MLNGAGKDSGAEKNATSETGSGDIHGSAKGDESEAENELEDPCPGEKGIDSDHCYQKKAWDTADPRYCDFIKGGRFAYDEINPPRNKCLSMVALKQCDPGMCDAIEDDGYFSPVDCKQRISRICP